MTPAEELRAAAAKVRRVNADYEAATPFVEDLALMGLREYGPNSSEESAAVLAYVGLWLPGVTDLVAQLLDDEAAQWPELMPESVWGTTAALKLARAIIGGGR